MTAKLMPIADAFRARLKAKYPDREDLLQINSRRQLAWAKSYELQNTAPAHEVLSALRADIASGKIRRLQGVLNGAMPADINHDHVKRGDLDVLEGTLTVEDKDEVGFTHRKIYRHVYIYAEDLPLEPTGRRGRRPTANWDVVEIALVDEIKRRGAPDFDNPDPKWRCQADVERWADEFLQARNESVGESTIRDRISQMLKAGK